MHNFEDGFIVDIDGTIAEGKNHRGPFEWDKVGLDEPRHEIIAIVNSLHHSLAWQPIFVSGRMDTGNCRVDTVRWIDTYINTMQYPLFMRADGDYQPDEDLKLKIYSRNIAQRWNVRLVLDDRPKVCRMWRSLGLVVAQVADPDVEF